MLKPKTKVFKVSAFTCERGEALEKVAQCWKMLPKEVRAYSLFLHAVKGNISNPANSTVLGSWAFIPLAKGVPKAQQETNARCSWPSTLPLS